MEDYRKSKKQKNIYGVKQALFDIFWLFYNQGVDSAYDEEIVSLYCKKPDKFYEESKKWTKLYASEDNSKQG